MHTIISHSIPFAQVLRDLAAALGTDFEKSCEEYTLIIPEKHGQGSIRGINFSEGIGFLLYDCTFQEDTQIRFIVNEVHPLKFLFCETGGFSHHFEIEKKRHHIEELENIIVASAKHEGHVLEFKGGVRTVINSIEIDRRVFLDAMACEIEELDPDLESLFQDVKAEKMFCYHGSYSLRMANLFSQMNNFEGGGFPRNVFLHGNSYNLLAIQILEYQDAKISEENRSVLLKRELKLVWEAAQIIDNNLLDFDTVQKLAARVGLNTNKLQNGFKEIFGNTVNEYLHNKRLETAYTLIKTTEYSFSEIANMIGISSKSYFSKIFKTRYGLTPSDIRGKNSQEKR